jgi:hypothetical protein
MKYLHIEKAAVVAIRSAGRHSATVIQHPSRIRKLVFVFGGISRR